VGAVVGGGGGEREVAHPVNRARIRKVRSPWRSLGRLILSKNSFSLSSQSREQAIGHGNVVE
jgi:hypothetical protein